MRKVFVDLTASFTKDGSLLPLFFVWEDGIKYEIDRVIDNTKAASLKAGGQGQRYRCKVQGKEIFIFFEEGKWFMEGK